jgi:hypothetical protein
VVGDGGDGGLEVGARGESFLLEVVHGERDGRRNYIADDVEVRAGLVDSEQNLELEAGLLHGGDGIRVIALELGELEIEALIVELGEVSGLVAVVADGNLFLEVGEVVVGELFGGLGDDEVGEGSAHGEDGLLHGELELVVGLDGGGAGGVDAPAAFFAALEEAADADADGVGVSVAVGFGEVAASGGEVRVLACGGLQLLRLDGEEVLLGG